MSRHIIKKILKGVLWALCILILLVIMVPVLLYIPAVQDFARNLAVKEVEKSTGMKINIDYLRLKFPLKLQADNVEVIEASGDTMLTARQLDIDVKMAPLLKGQIDVGGARLEHASYGMGNRDSVMMLRARIGWADIDGADIDLGKGRIMVSKAMVDSADVYLRMLPDSTVTPVDTTASKPWFIHADEIDLTRVRYRMEMLPTIDSLGCYVASASLRDGTVDMENYRVHGHSLEVDSVTATYLIPPADSTAVAAAPEPKDSLDATDSKLWTITADRLRLTGKSATYATRGAVPLPGLDMNYLQASDIVIEVDSFYNRGTSISVPLRRLSATERCGIPLIASGTFSMDSALMRAEGFKIDTRLSSLSLTASMGMGNIMADPDLPLGVDASGVIDLNDAATAFPMLKPMVAGLSPLTLNADIDGTASRLDVNDVALSMPGVLKLKASGAVDYPLDAKLTGGSVDINGSCGRLTPRFSHILNLDTAIHIPPMAIRGKVLYHPGSADGHITVTTGNGRIALDGKWRGGPQSYTAAVNVSDFPVATIMPSLGITSATADMKVKGHGYNPFSSRTSIDADIDLADMIYHGDRFSDIDLNVTLSDGQARGHLLSDNPGAEIDAGFTAALTADSVTWNLDGDVRNLDLMKLHFSPTLNRGSLVLKSTGSYGVKNGHIDARATIDNLAWSLPAGDITTPSIKLSLLSLDSLLEASVVNGDMLLHLYSSSPLMDFTSRVTRAADIAVGQIDSRRIDVDSISRALPLIDMMLSMGTNNVAARFLRENSEIQFRNVTAGLRNDSSISMNARVIGFANPSMRLDTISFDAIQRGRFLAYTAAVNNRPGTMDEFAHVNINGFVAANRLSVFLKQQNIKGAKGFSIGLGAEFRDSVAVVKFVPYNPTIGYRQWTLNRDNYVSYNFATRAIGANLALENEKSYLKLFTDVPRDTTSGVEDIVLQVSNMHLQDWLSISPFAPPVKGDISADMRFNWNARELTGRGTLGLTDLYYGRDRVGSFDLDVDLANTPGGTINADIALLVDSVKTITARGAINDSTASSPFLLDFSMIKFPLRVVNPFLPQGMAKLSGTLNGSMEITGDMAAPMFNGYLDFDSTAVNVKMLGTTFKFSDEKIPVDSNIVRFDNFAITACNENPLTVNGIVDLRHLSDIGIDLRLDANNIQIVNSTRPRGADAYGKAFLDLKATARGDMQRLNVNADVSVLAGTNVTYIIPEAQSMLQSKKTGELVKFVQFNDTVQTVKADSVANSSMILNVNANLHVDEGSILAVDLSSDGKNRAQIEGQGDLDFTMSGLNGERLTGRLNINGGYVRYNLIMSEKLFHFEEGSYVAFSGDMMNPTLNVKAVDRLRANVTQQGQNSRLVNFDVILSATGTLNAMNVAFDLSTDDDLTVENELASMSPEQRANQAMNMLLYNVYSGPGTKGNANLSGNALYSFLTSQLNNWAANNIKGVDISFGIDQYDKTYDGNTSTTTSYSYRVSKSLFNDRVKIIVGGNYSTDASADRNLSQNLINDISIEYLLNKSGSMYIRIFRHTGYESILEGEVTQTGVGFVFKRKLNSLHDLFRRPRKITTDNTQDHE